MDSQAAAIDREGMARGWIQLPERRFNPVRQILRRILYALIVLTAVAVLVMVERKGYKDGSDGDLDWLDAFYYATVTLSTTGYGDIVPVSDIARFTNIVVITPLRIAFLAILVGTTFQVLTRSLPGSAAQRPLEGNPCTDTLSSSATAPRDTTRSSS